MSWFEWRELSVGRLVFSGALRGIQDVNLLSRWLILSCTCIGWAHIWISCAFPIVRYTWLHFLPVEYRINVVQPILCSATRLYFHAWPVHFRIVEAILWLVMLCEYFAASIARLSFGMWTRANILLACINLVRHPLFVRFTVMLIKWQKARLDVPCLSVGLGHALLLCDFFLTSAFSDNFDVSGGLHGRSVVGR